MMGSGYCGVFGVGGGALMMIVGLLLIGLFLYFVLNKKSIGVSNDPDSNALEQAKIRLARGEITIEEFEQIKKHID